MLEYNAKDIKMQSIADNTVNYVRKPVSSFVAGRKGIKGGEKNPAAFTISGNKKNIYVTILSLPYTCPYCQ